MDNNRVLSALCYFSILFAPFLLPIIVFLVSQDSDVKHHAKRSFLSHLIPLALGVIGFIILMAATIQSFEMNPFDPNPTNLYWSAGVPLIFMIIYLIVGLIVTIWNIYQGVKVLR